VTLEPDGETDPSIEYAIVWKQRPGLLSKLPNLKVIFSLGAGVDHVFADPDLPDVPIVRVVSPNLTTRMSEYVVWQVLDHHRLGPRYRAQQAAGSGTRTVTRRLRATSPWASWAWANLDATQPPSFR
jgi:glyoxylate/hydroxypyruvate reductase A